MNNLDKQYISILNQILTEGYRKPNRTGVDTLSVFGTRIVHNMQDGFPILTTKKVAWKKAIEETLWFLSGSSNIQPLVKKGNYIWVGDAYANYYRNFEKYLNTLPEGSEVEFIINKNGFINKIKTDDEFAKKWGELGPVYGRQWRDWNGNYKLTEEDNNNFDKWNQNLYRKGIDQIQNLINELKTNPDSRRLVVTAWNPSDLPNTILPPCHYGFQVYTRELSEMVRYNLLIESGYKGSEMNTSNMMQICDDKNIPTRAISLMWNQRSADFPLGVPFNLVGYGALLTILAHEVNMIPEHLIGSFGDSHIYENQIEGVEKQVTRTGLPVPKVGLETGSEENYTFTLTSEYLHHPPIKFPLTN